MYGLTRAAMTLIGAAVVGFLFWLASQLRVDELGEYWAWLGLLAAGGLTMALSQLLGGWTKWGWPRISGSVFLLGFLPALIVGGLVLLDAQPDDDAIGTGWADDLGIDGLTQDLTATLPAIAFTLGLLLGFTFDTTGPRERVRAVDEDTAVRDRRRGILGGRRGRDSTRSEDVRGADRADTTEVPPARREPPPSSG